MSRRTRTPNAAENRDRTTPTHTPAQDKKEPLERLISLVVSEKSLSLEAATHEVYTLCA